MTIHSTLRRLLPALLLCVLALTAAAQPGTWTLTTTEPPGNPDLYGVHFFDGLRGLVAGDDDGTGVLYRTNDGGLTWARVTLPGSPGPLNDLFFLSDNLNGFVVGNNNYFARTADGGATWTQHLVVGPGNSQLWGGIAADIQSVYFMTPSRGWIVGRVTGSNGPRMAATNDRGQTWSEVLMSGPANNLYGIDFFDDTNGLVVGTGNPPRKSVSTNGGFTWEPNATMSVSVPASSTSMYGLDAIADTSVAYAVGGYVITAPRYPIVRRTTDHGATWSNVVTGGVNGLADPARDVLALGPSVIYVAGENGGLTRSTNAGASWTAETIVANPPVGTDDLWKFSLTPDNHAWVTGTGGVVLRTRLVPNATFNPGAAVDFGTFCPADPAVTRTIMVGNSGFGILNVTGTSIVQPTTGNIQFEIVERPSRIWPLDSERIQIRVRVGGGTRGGVHVGELRISTNDENGAGTDAFRTIDLRVTVAPNGVVFDSAVSRNAGTVRVGSLRAFTLTNFLRNLSGTCGAVIDSVYLARGRDYRLVRPIVHDTLAVGERVGVQLEFAPAVTCARHDTLVVLMPGPDTLRIPIVGTGVEATYATTPADTLSFGSVPVGSSGTATLRLINRRSGSCLDRTALRALTIAGPNAAEFTTAVRFTPGSSYIMPDAEVAVPITASPTAAGTRIAFAIIEHELSAVPDTVVLLVRGTDAALVSPIDEIVFPVTEVNVRVDSVLRTALRNAGTSGVTISDAVISGPDAAVFTLVAPTAPRMIAGGSTDSIIVGFRPTRVGTFVATLELRSDVGTTITIRLRGEGDVARGVLSTNPVVFPATPTGSCSQVTLTRFIRNTGRVPLRLLGLAIGTNPRGAAADPASFRIIETAVEFEIAPGDSFRVVLGFCPTRLGEHVASLYLTTNIPGFPLQDTLIGNAIERRLVELDVMLFPPTRLGTSRQGTADPFIRNAESTPIEVTALELVAGDVADFAIVAPTPPATVAANGTLPITVRFTPTARGSRNATLRVTTSIGTADVELTGTGIYPVMVVEGPLAPRARVGRTTPLTYWIHNRGDDTGRVDLVSITGSPAFTITSNGAPATLAAGDSLRVEIAFAPLTLCDHPLALQLSGEGVRSGILAGDTALAIAGLGVAPMLSARDRIIDFGTAAMGSTIDTVTTDFILNADPANPDPRCVDTVTVNAATISGVDAASFRIVSIGVPTTLEPGGPLPVTLEFTPTHAGINTALLEIRFDDATDSVLRITLVGNAGERPDVSVGLSFGGDHATEPGRTVRVPLILGGDIAVAAVDSLVVEVAYHRSLLRLDRVIVPAGTAVAGLPTFDAVNTHSLVTLANPAGIAAGTVAELEFTVLYGGVLVADVFADSAWAPSRSEVVIFSDSASVSIEEFCYANERRLSFGGELLVRAQPNPARDALVIEYELPASGETHLALYDASGRIVTVLVDGAASAGRYARALETRDLAAGTYYCVLRAGRFERTTIIRLQK